MALNPTVAQGEVLLLGRALHAPWNEGTRVIARNLAAVAGLLRPVQVMSLTRREFDKGNEDRSEMPVRHIYTGANYGAVGDYANLGRVIEQTRRVLSTNRVAIAHLIGTPLALAPWLHYRGIRVVNHITLCEQVYMGHVERMRAQLGWQIYDRWIDMYAVSSPALVGPVLSRGINPAKVCVVPAPVDTGIYSPDNREQTRRSLGIGMEDLAVVYVGTLSPMRFPVETIRKGLERASWRARRKVRFFAFAPNATHSYNRSWSEEVRQALADIPDVEVNVTLGDLSDTDKARWFRAADAVLVPFTAPVAIEPPLTMLEAMASGAVVTATPFANRSESITRGVNGYIYSTGEELEDTLVHVLRHTNSAHLKEMKRQARETIVRQYGFATVAASVANVWSRLERQ